MLHVCLTQGKHYKVKNVIEIEYVTQSTYLIVKNDFDEFMEYPDIRFKKLINETRKKN